jgi:DNA-binding phage protein
MTKNINKLEEKALAMFPKWKDDLKDELKDNSFANDLLKEAIDQFNKDGELKYFLPVIKDIVDYSNLNVSDLMERAGLTRPTFYNIVNLKTKPSFDTVRSLLKVFGANICFRIG